MCAFFNYKFLVYATGHIYYLLRHRFTEIKGFSPSFFKVRYVFEKQD